VAAWLRTKFYIWDSGRDYRRNQCPSPGNANTSVAVDMLQGDLSYLEGQKSHFSTDLDDEGVLVDSYSLFGACACLAVARDNMSNDSRYA